MDKPDLPPIQDDPDAIRQDIEATKKQIQSDFEALRSEVTHMVSPNGLRERVEANRTPLLAVGGGALLLAAFRWVNRHRERPAYTVAHITDDPTAPDQLIVTLAPAREEATMSGDMGKVIMALLVIEGVRWLQTFLANRKAAEGQPTFVEPIFSPPLRAQEAQADEPTVVIAGAHPTPQDRIRVVAQPVDPEDVNVTEAQHLLHSTPR